MIYKSDFLVIGGGVAGMTFALKVANSGKGKVILVCKTTLDEANTAKAQGGIASVTNLKVDNFEKHIEDTMIAGDNISNLEAVEYVVRNAPEAIRDLLDWGSIWISVRMERTTSIVKVDTASSGFFTMPTTQVLKFSAV